MADMEPSSAEQISDQTQESASSAAEDVRPGCDVSKTNGTNGMTQDNDPAHGHNDSAHGHNDSPQGHNNNKGCMKVLGVELAPFSLPFHRRMETFAVLQWWACFMFQGTLSLLLTVYLLFTSYYWVSLLMIAWVIYDRETPRRGGRRSEWMRRWKIWVHMRNYFPIHLIKTAEFDPKNNYLLGFHPHGIMSMGSFVNFGTEGTNFSETYPGIRPTLLTLTGWFYFPLARDYLMCAGLQDCGKDTINYYLSGAHGTGNAVALVVGGALESLEAHPKAHRLYLNRRRGFITMAMKQGAHLVPVYSFGETDIYEQMPNPEGSFLRWLQGKLTKLIGFAPPVYHGRGIFNYTWGLMPYRKPIYTVVGEPIRVEKNPNPTLEEVDAVHKTYKDALIKLFEENKLKYGVEAERRLSII